MRYYDIQIFDPQTLKVITLPSGAPAHWTTWVLGPSGRWQTDPGAPMIEFDISTTAIAVPDAQNSFLRIWGPNLKDIGQAARLTGYGIKIRGGMKPGLPLATAQAPQAGVLAFGTVNPCFGNWQGVNMSLDMTLTPFNTAVTRQPTNIVHNWKAGTPLATAIVPTLQTAYPGFKINVSISPNLVAAHDQPANYPNLASFAGWLKQKTAALIGGNYTGVDIVAFGNTVTVTDMTQQANKIVKLQFQDLIGQPTWLDLNQISIKTVLRGDLSLFDNIVLPPTAVQNTAASSPPGNAKNISSFQGSMRVTGLRHVGASRQPDGDSWASIFTAVPLPPLTSNVSLPAQQMS